jgi:dTDP-glucose 4,6-dehydratase
MRVLITGMTGFIGHHVADHLLQATDWELVGLDRIDATSTLHRLRYVKDWEKKARRCSFVWHDLRAPLNASVERQIGDIDAVLHLAASTHVARSITEPLLFVADNVMGTAHLLEWWRAKKAETYNGLLQRGRSVFVHCSTDEVFGPAEGGYCYKEWDRYNSASPYSASKAGAEELVCAYSNTYKFRAQIVRIMNVIGERQHPEKFVPMTVGKVLRGETVDIHCDADCKQVGTRFYLHAENVAHAIRWLIQRAERGAVDKRFDKWNVVGEREVSNLEMAESIAKLVDKRLNARLVSAEETRPGHDMRYALDGAKLRSHGFEYPVSFEAGLERTVRWFIERPEWTLDARS